jgi:hypothetical protein
MTDSWLNELGRGQRGRSSTGVGPGAATSLKFLRREAPGSQLNFKLSLGPGCDLSPENFANGLRIPGLRDRPCLGRSDESLDGGSGRESGRLSEEESSRPWMC